MKGPSALYKFFRLNLLQIKNSRSLGYLLAFIGISILLLPVNLHFGVALNDKHVSELSIEDNMSSFYFWMFKTLIIIYLSIQYCSFIESDMSSGMMFHRYSLGFTTGEESLLLVFYLFGFSLLYNLIAVLLVTIRFEWGHYNIVTYFHDYGWLRLPNECIRMTVIGLLATSIYLRTRRSALTFITLFLLWLAESIFIMFDEYWYAWGIHKYLPLHTLLSYNFISREMSLTTLFAALYMAAIGWLFYFRVKKTKESIILNHYS